MEKLQVYLAGSMFCEADRMYNSYLAENIRDAVGAYIDLYVPQENGNINDKTKCATSIDIFWGDYNRLKRCDIFIARIDGDIPPSGTSAEIGIMSQRRQEWERGLKRFQAECYLALGDNQKEVADEEIRARYIENAGHPPIILGLCTDSRNPRATYLDAKNEVMRNGDIESQYCYFNLFTVGCIKTNGELATSVETLVKLLSEEVKTRYGISIL